MTAVAPRQRYTAASPCPICGGHQHLPHGEGRRCWGFLSADGSHARCMRPEHAGGIQAGPDESFAHRLRGDCRCGKRHGGDETTSAIGSKPTTYKPQNGQEEAITGWYEYRNEANVMQYAVARTPSKQFPTYHLDAGRWRGGYGGAKRILYRLPELLAADPTKPVLVVEGEKDADRAIREGFIATCTPGGAKNARLCDLSPLEGRHVVIVPDKDDDGAIYQQQLIANIKGASPLRSVELPDFAKKDISDYFDAGGTAYSLIQILEAAQDVTTVAGQAASSLYTRARDGESALFGETAEVKAIVGDEQECVQAAGESLLIVGPDGVGKTSLAGQYALARTGARPSWIGFPVQVTTSKVFYGAHDRPKQAIRSMKRMVSDDDRDVLRERLILWEGPLPFDVGETPEALVDFLQGLNVDTYVIDGIKDIAVDLATDGVGSRVNHALQLCLQAGIQIVALHWPRKAQGDNKKPNKISDIYGSRLITAGFGSIVVLWGEAGDSVVEWNHIKQPADEVGPFKLLHDHARGVTTIMDRFDLFQFVRRGNGVTANEAARAMFETTNPDRNKVEKARRALQGLAKRGLAHEMPGKKGGTSGGDAARYFAVTAIQSDHETDHAPLFATTDHEGEKRSRSDASQIQQSDHETDHADHATTDHDPGSLFREPDVSADEEHCWMCGAEMATYDPDLRPICDSHRPAEMAVTR